MVPEQCAITISWNIIYIMNFNIINWDSLGQNRRSSTRVQGRFWGSQPPTHPIDCIYVTHPIVLSTAVQCKQDFHRHCLRAYYPTPRGSRKTNGLLMTVAQALRQYNPQFRYFEYFPLKNDPILEQNPRKPDKFLGIIMEFPQICPTLRGCISELKRS